MAGKGGACQRYKLARTRCQATYHCRGDPMWSPPWLDPSPPNRAPTRGRRYIHCVRLQNLLAEPAIDADIRRPERIVVEGHAGERFECLVAGEGPDREISGIGAELADAAQDEVQGCALMARRAGLEVRGQRGVGDLGAGGEVLDVMQSVAVDRRSLDHLVVAARILQMDRLVGGALGMIVSGPRTVEMRLPFIEPLHALAFPERHVGGQAPQPHGAAE